MSESTGPVRFTVFTPTYNRAHTLGRVYASLCAQTYRSFEWLVVDDGSTDDSQSLLDRFSKTAPFTIRINFQKNGGKHRAHNSAIDRVRGELVVILDSDDELTSDSLALLSSEWDNIPSLQRESYAGILGNSVSADNVLVGRAYADQFVDGKHFELAAAGIMTGDKLPCYRADVLRAFPFPERAGCNAYVPEGVVWTRISREYKVRCINQIVRIYHRDKTDTNSLMNSYKQPDSNAWGNFQYAVVVLNLSSEYCPRFFIVFLKAAINCTRYALHSKSGALSPLHLIRNIIGKAFWIALFPVGIAIWCVERIQISARRVQ
jgi:glycosyltransferase involved in cell wall biosynthesis